LKTNLEANPFKNFDTKEEAHLEKNALQLPAEKPIQEHQEDNNVLHTGFTCIKNPNLCPVTVIL
jgi:hypothetical protein